jgi:hypothetical protein
MSLKLIVTVALIAVVGCIAGGVAVYAMTREPQSNRCDGQLVGDVCWQDGFKWRDR